MWNKKKRKKPQRSWKKSSRRRPDGSWPKQRVERRRADFERTYGDVETKVWVRPSRGKRPDFALSLTRLNSSTDCKTFRFSEGDWEDIRIGIDQAEAWIARKAPLDDFDE